MISFLRWVLKVFILLMVLGGTGLWLHKHHKVDFSPLKQWLGITEEWVTYYQWYDANGQLIIGLKPPAENIAFTEFKGAPGLISQEQSKLHSSTASNIALNAEPKIKVLATYRDDLKDRLLNQEMTTQCRWLVSRIFELENEMQNAKSKQKSDLCSEYRTLLTQLPVRHCKATDGDIAPESC
jgi:hypothetical protein